VIRELLGHKLSQRQRKDLDEICEKANIRVKSCRRQVCTIDFHFICLTKINKYASLLFKFDNLKRIVRTIEDIKGPILKNITDNFCLPLKMAE
jgi:hypothetical protein